MDVEMWQVPQGTDVVIVLDTNILLEFLDTIQTFVSEVEEKRIPVTIIIPGAVIHELDALKNRDRLSWVARRASTWLLKALKEVKEPERKSVRSQAKNETCKSSGNWKVKEPKEELGIERVNDGLILDCCQYFNRKGRTILCSKDKLLAVEAESVGIPTLSPDGGSFGVGDLAVAVFGAELSKDDDGMEVDDDSTELVQPSHPLDQLHLEVIDHFGELLRELVAKVAPEAKQFGAADMGSMHAPGYARKELRFWTPTDALEYLETRKAWAEASPRVEVFLRRPYERGARRGQEWSRRDWEVALGTLRGIGDLWADGAAIGQSARAVAHFINT